MKTKCILWAIVTMTVLAACNKNDMTDDVFGVDAQKYEGLLSTDYSNALYLHNSLSNITTIAGGHASHHGGTGSTASVDTSYYMMMFSKNDSLFSEHYFNFCMDMVQKSGMMSASNGMMGNNSGMMGTNGGMMNGNTMGSTADMTAMMNYMESVHDSTSTSMNPDYMKTDSLMHNQMVQCKMMTAETDSIEFYFGKMQMLRKSHQIMMGD